MSDKIYTNNPSPIAIGRINFDVQQIKKEEDVIANEGIYFKFDIERDVNTLYHQLIIGPEDSPYKGGFYAFKAQFPDNYPFKPMRMQTLTQGEGVRKHPNLYICGKCCFSFLGTWQGPPWTPCNNPRSVAVSMRSVMTRYPLENEPSFENIDAKKQLHTRYAEIIKWFNIKHGVCQVLQDIDRTDKPYYLFKKHIVSKFLENFKYYIDTASSLLEYEKALIRDNPNTLVKSPVYNFRIDYNVKEVCKLLNSLYEKYSSQKLPIVISSDSEKQDKIVNDLDKVSSDIVNSSNVVNSSDINKEAKPKKSTKKTPNQKASLFDVGYKLKSSNDGNIYEVYQTKGKTGQKRWKKSS